MRAGEERAGRGVWERCIRDEDGLTTAGMAVALLLTLALVFSSAQVYRVNSAAADIQEVADAAALAAENPVAEFMVAVRLCDAVVLSLSLLGTVVYGAGVVALCVPPAAGVGARLVELGSKILEARDAFADRAAAGLNRLQAALPFLAAANAAAVGAANDGGVSGGGYLTAAVLIPAEGADIRVGADATGAALRNAVEADAAAVERAAAAAEEAAREAQEAKARAFERDCGANPGYCLYERADHLAGLDEAANPLYRSIDAWSFSVPLKRAQAYYVRRLAQERPSSDAVDEQARSALRALFYEFAVDELARGYVRESDGFFEAFFPRLPRNTDEMRQTSLYRRAVFPVTEGEGRLMHAWGGCPQAEGAVGRGSVADWDAGDFSVCPACAFTPSSLGNVASASTAIENGFEYHYAAIARAAEDYQAACERMAPELAAAKGLAESLIERCAEAARSAGSRRITAAPPGCKGAVALVVSTRSVAADGGFESLFVAGGMTLGARVAVSGATLLEDPSPEGQTVVSALLDGFGRGGGAAVGAARIVLDCWSGLLRAYGEGQAALASAVEGATSAIPLASVSGLGSWAAGALSDAFSAAGLQPARLNALRPVLVNSVHVAAAGEGRFSATYGSVREQALRFSSPTADLFTSVALELEAEALGFLPPGGRIEVARIELPVGDASFPVTIAVPPALTEGAQSLVRRCFDAVGSLYGEVTEVIRPWR